MTPTATEPKATATTDADPTATAPETFSIAFSSNSGACFANPVRVLPNALPFLEEDTLEVIDDDVLPIDASDFFFHTVPSETSKSEFDRMSVETTTPSSTIVVTVSEVVVVVSISSISSVSSDIFEDSLMDALMVTSSLRPSSSPGVALGTTRIGRRQ